MSLLYDFDRSHRRRRMQNTFWPWTLLVISVGIIFFQLGKVTKQPGQRVGQSPTLASPVYGVPDRKVVPRAAVKSRSARLKAAPKKSAKLRVRKSGMVRERVAPVYRPNHAGTVGIGPKIVHE